MKEQKLRTFNIQFFAEGGEGGTDGGSQEKTYSEKEYNKLKEDYDKLKTQFDKTSSDVAELKKKAKEKLTDDEKKAQENAEKEKQLADMQSQIEDYQLKDELVKGNVFTSEEIEKIITNKNDKKELLKSVITLVQTKIEEAKKQAIADFMRTSNGSGSNSANSGVIDADVQKFIESNKKNSTSKAREHYLK